MSLLLDALKKSGQARPEAAADAPASRDSSAHTPEPAPSLTLENLPPEPPRQKTARAVEDDLARLSGHNLLTVKAAPARPRLGIIPIALIAGSLFAAGGGYHVWREISPAPSKPPPNPPSQPAALVGMASSAPAPSAAGATPKGPAATPGTPPAAERNPGIPRRALANPIAPKAPQPIRIERTRTVATVDPALLAAYQAYRDGNLDTARQHYEDILRKDANSRDALLGLAAIAQQQSQDAAAAQYYRKVLALDPRDPAAHAGMSALIGATDMAATESRLKLLLSQKPQSVELLFALGNLYAEQSRWSDAQQAYFEAARRAPEDARVAFNLAVSLDHLDQGRPAAQYYRRALQLSPANAADFNRAQVQQRVHELTTP